MINDTIASLIISAYMGAAGDHAALYQGQLEPQFAHTEWTTHPYWENTDFRIGDISYDGVVYRSVPMRYNVLFNYLAVITREGQLTTVPDQQKIDWFELDGKRFVPEKGRFMREEYHGENASLLLSRSKEYRGKEITDRYNLKRIEETESYYLKLPDGTMHKVRNSKSISKILPEYKKGLQRLKREKQLWFRGDQRGEGLQACAEWVDMKMKNDSPSQALHLTNEREHADDKSGEMLLSQAQYAVYDSIVASVKAVDRVKAFHAYSAGNTEVPVYDDDDVATDDNHGIMPLSTLKETRTLHEVEVLGMRSKLSQQLGGVETFRPSLLRNIPLVMGEADVMKLATKLTGVSSTGEFASGINVRGGAAEHTLIQYNGNTIFNPMHMFGLFSAFNPDLVAETNIYKGGVPAQFGGRLSSVMDIKGKMPDRKQFHGSVSIGAVASKAMVEVPIIKDRMSLMLGGRATYSDWMLKLIPKEDNDGKSSNLGNAESYHDGKANYWDAGGTLSTMLSRNHTLLINGYYSEDRFSLTEYKKYAYSNKNYSAELRSHFGEKLSTTITAGYDHYDYANDETEFKSSAARLSFDLNQYFAKGMVNYALNDAHTINAGVQSQKYDIMPGKHEPLNSNSNIEGRQLADDKATESAVWVEDSWKCVPELTLTGGVRGQFFTSAKEGFEKDYFVPDVRLAANYKLSDNGSLKGGFNTLHQFLHKVSNTVVMSPTDTWVLSNSAIKPQSGWQLSAGYYRQTEDEQYEFSVEAYYKGMDNYLTYRNAAILTMNEELHKDVVGAKGRAYGIELQVRKFFGKLTGWINYTFSRTQLRQEKSENAVAINNGEWFAADYDSPHNIKLVGNYKFTRRYSTSINADYSTGRPFTAPIALMQSQYDGPYSVPVYSGRNTFRMPDYFRVDWSFNVEPGHHLTARTHSWFTLGVYNLLGRKNVYSIYFEGEGHVKGKKLSVFGAPIPYVSYNITF